MRTFLIILGTLAYAAAVLLFMLAQGNHPSAIIEIESFICFCSGTVAFAGGGVIGAIRDLRDDTVRLSNIERIEAKQRELAQAGK